MPQVAAFMDAVEPCLFSVYTATVLAAVDALLAWARATSNEFWCAHPQLRHLPPSMRVCRDAGPPCVCLYDPRADCGLAAQVLAGAAAGEEAALRALPAPGPGGGARWAVPHLATGAAGAVRLCRRLRAVLLPPQRHDVREAEENQHPAAPRDRRQPGDPRVGAHGVLQGPNPRPANACLRAPAATVTCQASCEPSDQLHCMCMWCGGVRPDPTATLCTLGVYGRDCSGGCAHTCTRSTAEGAVGCSVRRAWARSRLAALQDREPGTSRAAIQALAHIVLCVESAGLIETLMDLLSSGDAHLVSEVRLRSTPRQPAAFWRVATQAPAPGGGVHA